ncbi:hypothetical protein WG906_18200 [Pedobacter sp. P351]|uniref:hypothetical protein n=1 Tax=Pedobacter superstes TaxID=3133441 RepID=UPI00309AD166
MSLFLKKITNGINKIYGEDPLRKAFAVHIVNYIVHLDKQEFEFNVRDLGVFARLNVDYLAALLDVEEIDRPTPLFEATMLMLMKTNLIFEKDLRSGNDWENTVHISGYSIFKTMQMIPGGNRMTKEGSAQGVIYKCILTNEFWNDYGFQMNLN